MRSGPVSVTRWRAVSIITIFSTYYSNYCKTLTTEGKGILGGGVDLKVNVPNSDSIGTKQMDSCYIILFYKILNTSILNAVIMYRYNFVKKQICWHSEVSLLKDGL